RQSAVAVRRRDRGGGRRRPGQACVPALTRRGRGGPGGAADAALPVPAAAPGGGRGSGRTLRSGTRLKSGVAASAIPATWRATSICVLRSVRLRRTAGHVYAI